MSLFAKASQQGNVAETAKVKLGQKQGNVALPAGLRKHLGKARSAAVPPPPPPALVSSKRRDDSLLQQHDWIQGAILLCKNSFNASPGNLLLLFCFPLCGDHLLLFLENIKKYSPRIR